MSKIVNSKEIGTILILQIWKLTFEEPVVSPRVAQLEPTTATGPQGW